ncbi:MAG: hypothetical protein J5736_02950, partial [Bacilli bacterium]|nr:hypothetical protein [Bacilli bacterium]
MKKSKLALGLLAVAASAVGLSGCNDVTAKEGVVLELKINGESINYTTDDLFGSYRVGAGYASTSFDKVYEVLIRHYYQTSAKVSDTTRSKIDHDAQAKVNSILNQADTNATNNGTSYEKELEVLLTNNGVDNIAELKEAKVYEVEKSLFETDYYSVENLNYMRDGVNGEGKPMFPAIDDPDTPADESENADNEGYLKEKMPYHVSHILAKLDADGSLTQGLISEADAKQLHNIITRLAGEGATEATRESFQTIAFSKEVSDDTSSASYGDLGIMDLGESYVNEFKLGVYAYDALYNKAADTASRTDANKERLLVENDVTMTSDDNVSVRDYFAGLGIGTIPYGAAVALGEVADVTDANGMTVNNGEAKFFPRNIIYNKYFNKHNVCVIVPNDIYYHTKANDATVLAEIASGVTTNIFPANDDDGTYEATYGALPGFQKDTTALLPSYVDKGGNDAALANNVLTDKDGRIILVVKAGSASDSGYQGIHFIAINRSALDGFGSAAAAGEAMKENTAAVDGTAALSEYYTLYAETDSSYPKDSQGKKLLTYNNFIKQDATEYIKRRDALRTRVKGATTNIEGYIFQSLLKEGNLTFNSEYAWLQNSIDRYISSARQNSKDTVKKSFNESWTKYAQLIEMQESLRAAAENGLGEMIPEIAAIGYTSDAAINATGI